MTKLRGDCVNTRILKEFECPITKEIFFNPVAAHPCGHLFEEEAIKTWALNNNKCPCCHKVIMIGEVAHAVKNAIRIIMSDEPELRSSQYLTETLLREIILSGKEDEYLHELILVKDFSDAAAEIYNSRGNSKYQKKDIDGAIKDYTIAIELTKLDLPKASYYFNRGDVKATNEDLKGAIEDYDIAINLDTSKASYYHNRGSTKANNKNFKGAIEDYDIAINLDSSKASYYSNRGRAKIDNEDFKGAIKDFDIAINLDSSKAFYYFIRGLAKLKIEDFDGAIADNTDAIKYGLSSTIPCYFNRGSAKFGLKNFDGAIDDLKEAIKLCDSNKTETMKELTTKLDQIIREKNATNELEISKQSTEQSMQNTSNTNTLFYSEPQSKEPEVDSNLSNVKGPGQ